jgi:MFS family permease
MVGVFWGSPLFGWTSDTYGRKPTIVACLSLCLASMALIRFARLGFFTLPNWHLNNRSISNYSFFKRSNFENLKSPF